MKCEEYREFFEGWLTNDQSPAEKKELEQHLVECADCSKELEAMQLLWNEISIADNSEQFPDMRNDFEVMLNEFKNAERKTRPLSITGRIAVLWNAQPKWPLAYVATIILICFGGMYWLVRSGNARDQQMAVLSEDMHILKQEMMVALLENPSASERIRAASYTEGIKNADQHTINALLLTLNNDPDVNVRLSTLDALAKFAANPKVREELVHSIARQDSPFMQYAIADLMLQLQEKRSVKPFKELLKQNNLDPSVREKITETITKLI
jgi:HEAT repeat protein